MVEDLKFKNDKSVTAKFNRMSHSFVWSKLLKAVDRCVSRDEFNQMTNWKQWSAIKKAVLVKIKEITERQVKSLVEVYRGFRNQVEFMPSYDLVCQDCGHKFSVFCTISQKDRQVCPQCQSSNIKQRFTSVNIGGGGSKVGGGNCSASSCSG